MNQKFLINIFGAMTTGKTTLVEGLQKHNDRIYTVDYDVVKKQISGFYSKRDRDVATKITYDTLASVAATKLSILALLPPPKDRETYHQLEQIARDNNLQVINIELVAPIDVLVSRYEQRLVSIQASGQDIDKLRTVNEFKETVQTPYFRPDDTYTFDSSVLSTNEIIEQAIRLL